MRFSTDASPGLSSRSSRPRLFPQGAVEIQVWETRCCARSWGARVAILFLTGCPPTTFLEKFGGLWFVDFDRRVMARPLRPDRQISQGTAPDYVWQKDASETYR
jgi:hypothetical protein